MTTSEFVMFDEHGREIDWIDPVEEFEETDAEWIVHNGYVEYRVTRLPGYRYEIRARSEAWKGKDDE